MTATCPSCGAPQAEGLLCATDVLHLTADLRAIPGLVDDLDVAVSKQARLTTSGRGSKGAAHERWGFGIDASAVAWELEQAVVGWSITIAPDAWYGREYLIPRGTRYAASILIQQMSDVRKHPEVDKLTEKIHAAVAAATEHVLGPRERTRIPVGPCPELNPDGSHCDGAVVAYIPRQDAAPSRMQCKLNPDHRWTSIQFYRAGKRIHDRAEQKSATA